MSTTASFTELTNLARRFVFATEAEFDYSLAFHGGEHVQTALSGFQSAAWILADQQNPGATHDELTRESEALMSQHWDAIEEMRAAAKAKTYTGWSDVAKAMGQTIQYS
jgi:hypothetical protein